MEDTTCVHVDPALPPKPLGTCRLHREAPTQGHAIMPFAATRMDLEIIILSEESQAEKDIYYIISMLNLKKQKMQINLFTKQKQTHRL